MYVLKYILYYLLNACGKDCTRSTARAKVRTSSGVNDPRRGKKKNQAISHRMAISSSREDYFILVVGDHFLFFLIVNKKVSLRAHSAVI